jgi:hypothetical protein
VGHPEDARTAAAEAGRYVSPEATRWYAEHCAVFGSVATVVDRLHSLRGLADMIVLAHLGGSTLPTELVEVVSAEALPRLR